MGTVMHEQCIYFMLYVGVWRIIKSLRMKLSHHKQACVVILVTRMIHFVNNKSIVSLRNLLIATINIKDSHASTKLKLKDYITLHLLFQ